MYGRKADLAEITALWRRLGAAGEAVETLICPPAPYIEAACAAAAGTDVTIGAQDCSAVGADSARTGEFSAAMLADVGARYVIVGHSERRSLHGESDGLVRRKAEAVIAAGLVPIVCVGETEADRAAGRVAETVGAQVRNSCPAEGVFVLAYEPIWAVGSDRTPTPAEITDVHMLARETLGGAGAGVRVLYGGSVNPANAGEVLSADGVDGALVGRASLRAEDFAAIILSHPTVS